ncbi:MAG: DNA-formamidopyrimidine glycosylase family protein [Solirubrobacteraceae bacterium]
MPELPEVEITVRRLGEALTGAPIEDAAAQGLNTRKSIDPPLSALRGAHVQALRRRGKLIVVDAEGGLSLLIHLMPSGRLQLYQKPSPSGGAVNRSPRTGSARPAAGRDRSTRLTERHADGRELRLRELGSKQSAWVKPLPTAELDADSALCKLGPEAWPDPPAFAGLLGEPRPLHALLRDQRVIAGIGRSWADEILWSAQLSPYKRGADLSPSESRGLRLATVERLGAALDHYERMVRLPIPTKLPMPLQVHRRVGEPCPRCATPIAGVHFEDYTIAYCPACQTDGRVLRDRRRSRLLL